MRRVCRAAAWVYAGACLLALAAIPATGAGLLAPDPFVALPAVVLGLPGSFLAIRLFPGEPGVVAGMALIAAGMAVNGAALRWLCRRG